MQSARNSEQTATDQRASVAAPRAQTSQSNASARLATQQSVLIRSICELLDESSLEPSLHALANELQRRFKCDRAAVALHTANGLSLRTLSQQAHFDPKSTYARQLTLAMEEACEQDSVLHFSGQQSPDPSIHPAHHALKGQSNNAEFVTLPLCWNGEPLGALLLEREADKPWSAKTIELLRQISAMAAPIIGLRQSDERPAIGRFISQLKANVGLNTKHLTAKFFALVVAAGITIAAVVPGPHEIGASAELLPEHRRVISAPFSSYISQVHVGSGDVVAEGTPLLSLDTKDLDLEREKIESVLLSARTEFRAAMANRDRKEMAISQARQQEAQAQVALVESQIARAQITAPQAGVVTSGELKQSLGAPIQRGDVLLELAPAQGYRVVLWVDELDISHIAVGQSGRLSMRTSPADGLPFEVQRIHPIATPEAGANLFRVEASLAEHPEGLRPGHTGYGKIEVGQASYLWLWTHRFTNWFAQRVWTLFG